MREAPGFHLSGGLTLYNEPMTTGRVLWIIWCLAWAGVWAVLAAVAWPRRACLMASLISTNGNFCMAYGTVGSWPHVLVLGMAAVCAAAAIALPVGKLTSPADPGRTTVPPPRPGR